MITSTYSIFFKELAQNNNSEWFREHKKSYENDVKKPFLNLLNELIPELLKIEPQISDQAKDALFRINKDIRFSKDKTPYHTIMKAGFSPGGKKSFLPGYYLGISAEEIHVGGGLFQVEPAELHKIRTLISKNSKDFLSIIGNPTFKSSLGEILGEKAKRFDAEHMEAAKSNPVIANKQFYAMAELPLKDYLNSENLASEILNYFKIINPLNQFLKKAF